MMNCLTGSHFLGLHTGHLLNKGGVNLAPELSPDRARVFVLNATKFVWVDSYISRPRSRFPACEM